MTGFFGATPADAIATWVAAAATLVVLGGLLGERRLFGWSQHLLAGLATGFLALIVITELLVPRVVAPLMADPGGRPELWLAVALVGAATGAPWLPRAVGAVPLSVAIGALAAFALGGAVVGTLLPQLAAVSVRGGEDVATTIATVAAGVITVLVLLSFVRGVPRGRLLRPAASAGRWLLLAGIGGWFGYLLFSRLILLLDRIGFLLGDWLRIGG
ncbi:MAG TPA: hypothetical protein VFM03_00450 [Candidatus Limnocylindria bacterium]|nr:hypothetical protein [Candidatus Limnocylindria bacterium]